VDGFDALIPFDVDPDKGKIHYRQVARHECGHAVVAVAMQKRVKYIRLGRLYRTETHAETDHEPKDDARVECLIASAGVVAERRFTESVPEGSAKLDHDSIRWWVRRDPAAFSGFEDTHDWFATFIAAMEAEADQVLAENEALFHALVSKLDWLMNGWDWIPPKRFVLKAEEIDDIIEKTREANQPGAEEPAVDPSTVEEDQPE
jgi:hypothetical protein